MPVVVVMGTAFAIPAAERFIVGFVVPKATTEFFFVDVLFAVVVMVV